MDNSHSVFQQVINYEMIITPNNFLNYKEDIQRQIDSYLNDKVKKYGYIVKDTIKILGYSDMILCQKQLNGTGLIYVKFECMTIKPIDNKVYKCEIIESNSKSFLCQPIYDPAGKIRPINIYIQQQFLQDQKYKKYFEQQPKKGDNYVYIKLFKHHEDTIHNKYQATGTIVDEKDKDTVEMNEYKNIDNDYIVPEYEDDKISQQSDEGTIEDNELENDSDKASVEEEDIEDIEDDKSNEDENEDDLIDMIDDDADADDADDIDEVEDDKE